MTYPMLAEDRIFFDYGPIAKVLLRFSKHASRIYLPIRNTIHSQNPFRFIGSRCHRAIANLFGSEHAPSPERHEKTTPFAQSLNHHQVD